jgi:hypothetical protein
LVLAGISCTEFLGFSGVGIEEIAVEFAWDFGSPDWLREREREI